MPKIVGGIMVTYLWFEHELMLLAEAARTETDGFYRGINELVGRAHRAANDRDFETAYWLLRGFQLGHNHAQSGAENGIRDGILAILAELPPEKEIHDWTHNRHRPSVS